VSDGSVWSWGYNATGQLGNGTTTDSDVPVPVSGLSGVTAVAGGAFHSLAIVNNGTVWGWGRNNDGQLGNGTTTDSHVPVQVSGLSGEISVAAGALHSLALGSDGAISTWGSNAYGQLGNGTTTDSDVPVTVSGVSGVTAVAAGTYHSIALVAPPSPVVSGVNPSALGQGANNRTVTISGSGFVGPAMVTISGTGVTVTNVVVVSSAEITASVSVAATASTGPDDVTVTNADSGVGSCTGCLTIDAAPMVTGVNPNALGQGANGWTVTISGSGFVSPATVKIMGAHFTVKHVVVVSSVTITASVTVVSSASPGAYDVKVTNADSGIGICPACFTVDVAPSVTGANPSSLARGASNVDLVISGANFVGGATVSFSKGNIRINSLSVDNSGQITLNVTVRNVAATGPRTITVVNPDGGKGSCSTCFSVT
jgi:hypothetical protein